MSKQAAIVLSIIMVVSMGAVPLAVGGVTDTQSTTTAAVSAASVTKSVSINESLGTANSDRFRASVPTSDGGYLAVGHLGSFPDDMWVVKFDSSGTVVWNKTYGLGDSSDSNKVDEAWDVVETTSGYVIAGKDDRNGVLVKIDDQGNKQWAKNYGGFNTVLKSVVTTSDGYAAAGETESDQGDTQAFLVRTDGQGAKQWSKQYGAVDSNTGDFDFQTDIAQDLVASGDGGFVFVGRTDSFGAGDDDDNVWVLKTDGQGIEQWNKSFGDTGDTEQGEGIVRTSDGGYVIAAHQQPELWAIKIDGQGTMQWNQFYLASDSSAHSGKSYLSTAITETNDGNYLMIGEETASDFNTVAVKFKGDGTALWNTSFPDNLGAEFSDTTFFDVDQTSDGDFVFSGQTADFGPGPSGIKSGILMKIGFSADGATGGDGDTSDDGNETSGGGDGSTSSDPVQLSVQNATGSANGTVTVTFNFTNTNGTSLSGPALKVTEYPSNWTISSTTDAGSTYSESSGTPTWLWLSISAGASKEPTITFKVPNSTQPGEYTVSGQADPAGDFTTNDSGTVTISESGAKTIDDEIAGQDGTIGITDIQRAIRLWANDNAVPNTGGKTIGIVKIQELIQQWASAS